MTHIAIYHCSIKIIGRKSGRTAVAAAAYRSGKKLLDKETGVLHDFTRKSGVVFSEIILPVNAPDRFKNREVLWNEVQKIEDRKDAQLAREIEVAFPAELDRETQLRCARDYINTNFVSEGMIADWSLHDKGDGNPHAHIMLTTRAISSRGKWCVKQKTYFANTTDKNGIPIYDSSLPTYNPRRREETDRYRIPLLDENGKQKVRIRPGKGTERLWVKVTVPLNDWNDRSQAEKWRKAWADECNKYLEEEKRIDHRSYKRQGIELEPTIHEGVTARKIEKNGKTADRCQINRKIRNRNNLFKEIYDYTRELTGMVMEKVRTIIEAIRIRRGTRSIDGSRRYYLTDELFGNKIRCSRSRSERCRETAGRIAEAERISYQTERDIERTAREINSTEQAIAKTDNYIRIIKNYYDKQSSVVPDEEPEIEYTPRL